MNDSLELIFAHPILSSLQCSVCARMLLGRPARDEDRAVGLVIDGNHNIQWSGQFIESA